MLYSDVAILAIRSKGTQEVGISKPQFQKQCNHLGSQPWDIHILTKLKAQHQIIRL